MGIKFFRSTKPEKKIAEIDNKKNPDLQLAFTSADGTELYAFKEFLKIPALRAIAGERATRFQELNVTESLLKQSIKKIKGFMNKSNWVDAMGVVSEIEVRLAMFGEEETVLEIAYCYILLKDESPDIITAENLKRKKELCANDPTVRAFFLSTAFKLIKKYSNISAEDFLKYLSEVEAISKRLNYQAGERL